VQAIFRKTRWMRAFLWGVPLVLAACLTPPDLPPRERAAIGDSPGLVPTSEIIARAAHGPNTPRLMASPEARITGLRARAAALRGPVIPPDQRQRMLTAKTRLR